MTLTEHTISATYRESTGTTTPDLMAHFEVGIQTVVEFKYIGAPLAPMGTTGADQIVAWSLAPASDDLDWAHLERIDQEGWGTD
jgi:hypothetical protein